MNSADAWHESNDWPNDPYGDMTAILEASVEAAKERHPSGAISATTSDAPEEAPSEAIADALTAADRCDQGCGGAALYLLRHTGGGVLALCHHHGHRYAEGMGVDWTIVGHNATLMSELYGGR